MVITCGDCGARFRLAAALLKGAKGVRVRCRRCGGNIVVLRPEDQLILSADDPVPTEPPPPDPQEAVAGEDTALPQAVTKADADLPPAPKEAGLSEEAAPSEEIVSPVPEREVFPVGRSHKLKYFIVAGMSILLLAVGTLYILTTKSGRERVGNVSPTYDIRDVKLSFEKQTASGTLFVVKGKVANVGKGPSGGIDIRATLQGKDNQALAEKSAFAGNILDEVSLRQMDRSGIEGAMANRFGEGSVNKEIPRGKVLQFMVIFFDPPGEIEAVSVMAMDAR